MNDNHSPIYLLDGGLGTTLADHYNCIFNDGTPLWSSQLLLTSPSTLLQAQSAFARAGADIVLTATYQASFEGFERSGVNAEDAREKMREAVGIARKAFGESEMGNKGGNGRKGKVALSLGAYGAIMLPSQEYSGKYDSEHVTRSQLREWHLQRLEVFSANEECWREVDYVAFETLPLLDEILAVREVLACQVATEAGKSDSEKAFWISCVFPGEENVLPDGSSVREVVEAMLGKREGTKIPMGVGINCTKVGKVEGLIKEFESAIRELVERGEVDEWPSLVIYPDGTKGEVYNTTTKEWEKVGEEGKDSMSWDEILMGIVERARRRGDWKSILVGGCCKTTPDDIANLRKRINEN